MSKYVITCAISVSVELDKHIVDPILAKHNRTIENYRESFEIELPKLIRDELHNDDGIIAVIVNAVADVKEV